MSQYAQIRLYKASDLGLASALLSLSFDMLSMEDEIDTRGRPRKVFLFRDSDDLQEIVNKYWSSELRLEPQKLMTALRSLKSRMHHGE
jgi:hypothetical protein